MVFSVRNATKSHVTLKSKQASTLFHGSWTDNKNKILSHSHSQVMLNIKPGTEIVESEFNPVSRPLQCI